jgi:hypothetical protein
MKKIEFDFARYQFKTQNFFKIFQKTLTELTETNHIAQSKIS